MNQSILDACEEIDAGFFSGDIFHNSSAIEQMEHYLGRWQRELKVIKEMLEQDEEW